MKGMKARKAYLKTNPTFLPDWAQTLAASRQSTRNTAILIVYCLKMVQRNQTKRNTDPDEGKDCCDPIVGQDRRKVRKG